MGDCLGDIVCFEGIISQDIVCGDIVRGEIVYFGGNFWGEIVLRGF